MAARQYLIPGGAFVNEHTSGLELLVPGNAMLNESSTADAAAAAESAGQFRAWALLMQGVPHMGYRVPRPVGV